MSDTLLEQTVARIAAARVYEVAAESPLDLAGILSERLANQVYIKREDLQSVFSFKLRGAYNKMASLSAAERASGVIAASAGNHAQGVALGAARLGIDAVIVMPKTTPGIKVDAVRRLGGSIVLHGSAYDEAYEHAAQLVETEGRTFVHPYDDPEVIAGQGTVAKEILGQLDKAPDVVFIPVGGGGLAAGMAAYLKIRSPETRIIGVEPQDAGCLAAAMAAGERVVLDEVGIFADGVAVRQVGRHPYAILKDTIDEVMLVSTDEICAAIKDIYDDTRSIAEPAGALGVAGLKKYVVREAVTGQTLVAVDSGANINFDRLRHVAERAELGENREALLAVRIPEQPGSFRDFCHALGPRSITEFNYRYGDDADAYVFAGVELRDGEADRQRLFAHLRDKGYAAEDISDNEVAKLHLRYMVGGRAATLSDERLYRFQFPERPGALMRFLTHMSGDWNISLFHYRNHGADFGRVLVGIQVADDDMPRFARFLDDLGYPWWDESANAAYRLFMR